MTHNVYWGSHGCDRPYPHAGPCACHHFADEECEEEWMILTQEWPTYGEGTPQYAGWRGDD